MACVPIKCNYAADIAPRDNNAYGIIQADALSTTIDIEVDCIISNPPRGRKILHPMITHFVETLKTPSWLLFDANWAHTKQSIKYQPLLKKIVSVGRVKWIEGTKMTGKEDCAWYLFTPEKQESAIKFYGRTSV